MNNKLANRNLSFIVHNIRSLPRHFSDLLLYLDGTLKQQPDLIILTETWLDSENFKYFQIEGYVGYISQRDDGTRSGGVVLYVKNGISHSYKAYSNNFFQAISIIIDNKKASAKHLKQIQIVGIYRDQRRSQNEFISKFIFKELK